jgi:hypothetical protein
MMDKVAVWLDTRPGQARLIDTDWVETAERDGAEAVQKLLENLSYSASYIEEAVASAQRLGVEQSRFCFVARASEVAFPVSLGRADDGSVFLGELNAHTRARAAVETERSIARLKQRVEKVLFTLGEGEISSKGIRLIYKRCGLDSLEAAESLVAERPADLPPVGVVESKGLAVILERSGVETTSRLVVDDTWSPTIDAVAEGMRETAQGTGPAASEVIAALGPVDEAVVGVLGRGFWFAPSAARSLQELKSKFEVSAQSLFETLSSDANYVEQPPLGLPVCVVGPVRFVQSAGRQRLIAAVMDAGE